MVDGLPAAGVGAAIALDPIVAALGAIGFVAGLPSECSDETTARCAPSSGHRRQHAVRSELDGFFGLSAIIGITVCAALLVAGLLRRKSAIREPAWIALGSVGVLALLAVVGLGVAASGARPDIKSGADTANRALDALDDNDFERAAELFDQAAANYESVSTDLDGALAMPARLVPVVSQNARAGADLADVAADGFRQAASSLRQIDPADLAVSGGAIDLDAVRAVEAPLEEVQRTLIDIQAVTNEVRSPWLASPIQDDLDELDEDLAELEPRLVNAIDAVRLAPQMFGGDAERNYLILFTSPAEARGIGGFVGNYAEVNVANGRITVTDFSRRSDLEDAVSEADVRCDPCPDEFLDRYGRFGFTTGPNDGVAERAWSNLTMPAHFPHIAEVATTLYPQSGGRNIDGVLLMDPYVVEVLMAYTGPIELPEFGITVRPEDAAEFILEDQYLLAVDDEAGTFDNDERLDALETLGEEVFTRLLSGDLPEPAAIATDLEPLVDERRLMFWTADEAERDLADSAHPRWPAAQASNRSARPAGAPLPTI